jgi:epsin
MKNQRATRKDMRNRMAGERGDDEGRRERPSRASPPAGGDSDLQRAIEASKRSAEDEGRRNQDEGDLEKAMRLSREEEERRQRELAANGGGGLFDDQQQQQCVFFFISSLS